MKLMPAAASKTFAAWHARWDKLGLREQLLVLGATVGVGRPSSTAPSGSSQSRLHQQLNQRIAALGDRTRRTGLLARRSPASARASWPVFELACADAWLRPSSA